jgi:hypothetical protein
MWLRSHPRLFNAFKLVLYTLLIVNIGMFLRHGTLNEALDSLGWVLLLGVFEWETRSLGEEYLSRREKILIWVFQLVGYGLALNAARVYFNTAEWVDFSNATLWLLVCCTVVYDVFVPGEFGSLEWKIRNGFKIFLYVAILAIAVYWGITSDWLDFYDASLWILCFFMIEMNIFKHETELDARAEGAAMVQS